MFCVAYAICSYMAMTTAQDAQYGISHIYSCFAILYLPYQFIYI